MNYSILKIASRYCGAGVLTSLLFCMAMFLSLPATAGFYDKPAKIRTTPEEWLPHALAGDAQSQLNLGWAYENGAKGVEKSLTEAAKWYGMAAANGLHRGVLLYAEALEEGKGVDVDLEAAKTWYESINDRKAVARVIQKQRVESNKVQKVDNEIYKHVDMEKERHVSPSLDKRVVTDIQIALNKMGYKVGKVDGAWGLGTLSASHLFAKDFNYVIPPNITNDVLLAILHSVQGQLSRKSASSRSKQTVSNAFNSLDSQVVTKVQSALVSLGYRVGRVDGVLGSKSKEALGLFTRDYNLELPRPITNQVLSDALYSLNKTINEKYSAKHSNPSYEQNIPKRAARVETYRGNDGEQRRFSDGLVAFITLSSIFIVIAITKRLLAKVDANRETKQFVAPKKIDPSSPTKKIISPEPYISSSYKKSNEDDLSSAHKRIKKKVSFDEKFTRYAFLYVALLVMAPLFIGGGPVASAGILACFMAGWGGIFGDLFHKIGLVKDEGMGGMLSVIIGIIIVISLAFI